MSIIVTKNIVCNCNIDKNLGIYSLPKKTLHKKLNSLMYKCSNPLNYHKKQCVVFWDYIDTFNDNIETIQYGIKMIKTNDDDNNGEFGLYNCLENEDHTVVFDECKIYE
jgi:hypothetical protein|uniref:Uncharacterized protein n=1 Tax=viral metagenome TaxID=1070528 RepID=A0A6C0BR85_9ZZZZ